MPENEWGRTSKHWLQRRELLHNHVLFCWMRPRRHQYGHVSDPFGWVRVYKAPLPDMEPLLSRRVEEFELSGSMGQLELECIAIEMRKKYGHPVAQAPDGLPSPSRAAS